MAKQDILLPQTIECEATLPGRFILSPDGIHWKWYGTEYMLADFVDTDFASVPAPFRWFVSRTGRHQIAAAIHDACYANSRTRCIRLVDDNTFAAFSKWQVEDMFQDALMFAGVPWYQRAFMVQGVKAFGWLYWGEGPWYKKLFRVRENETIGQLVFLVLFLLAAIGTLVNWIF